MNTLKKTWKVDFQNKLFLQINNMIESEIVKEQELNCWRATVKINLPPITVVKVQSDKSSLHRSITREVNNIVSEYLEKNLEI